MRFHRCIPFIVLAAWGVSAQGAQTSAPDSNFPAAEAYLAKGDYAKAVEALELALRAGPKRDPELYMMLAVARLNLADRAGAVEACERGLEAFPGSARILGYYVNLLPEALPASEVLAKLERAWRQSPDSPLLQKALGKAFLGARIQDPRVGQWLASARKALPRDPEAQFLYGQWACVNEREAVCVDVLHQALALTPADNFTAHLLAEGLIAVAEDRLDHPENAKHAFDRALAANRKLNPPRPEVPYQYVKFLLGRNEHAAAARVVDEILSQSPSFAPAHLDRAKLLFRESQPERALDEAMLALKYSEPDKAQLRAIHSFLVKTCSTLGRDKEAQEHQDWVDANP
jgi:tetratricopeptide (TPR) repeat protein